MLNQYPRLENKIPPVSLIKCANATKNYRQLLVHRTHEKHKAHIAPVEPRLFKEHVITLQIARQNLLQRFPAQFKLSQHAFRLHRCALDALGQGAGKQPSGLDQARVLHCINDAFGCGMNTAEFSKENWSNCIEIFSPGKLTRSLPLRLCENCLQRRMHDKQGFVGTFIGSVHTQRIGAKGETRYLIMSALRRQVITPHLPNCEPGSTNCQHAGDEGLIVVNEARPPIAKIAPVGRGLGLPSDWYTGDCRNSEHAKHLPNSPTITFAHLAPSLVTFLTLGNYDHNAKRGATQIPGAV